MTADEVSPIWRVVFRRLGEWEADDGVGTARPTFEAAWRDATSQHPPAKPATPQERDACWQAWLHAGAALTKERATELLRSAATRAKDGQLFGVESLRRVKPRDPGEEG
jgi:hypothetical protein